MIRSNEKVDEIAKVMMEGEMNLVCEGKDRWNWLEWLGKIPAEKPIIPQLHYVSIEKMYKSKSVNVFKMKCLSCSEYINIFQPV